MGPLLKLVIVLALITFALAKALDPVNEPYRPNYKQIPRKTRQQYQHPQYDPCCPTSYNPIICRNQDIVPYRQQQIVYAQPYQQEQQLSYQEVPSYSRVVYSQPRVQQQGQVVTSYSQVPNYSTQQRIQVPTYNQHQVQVPTYSTQHQVQVPTYNTQHQVQVPTYSTQHQVQVPTYSTQQHQVPTYNTQIVPGYSQQRIVYSQQPLNYHVNQVPQQKVVTYQSQPVVQHQSQPVVHQSQPIPYQTQNQVVYKQQPLQTYGAPTYSQAYSQPYYNNRRHTAAKNDPYANIPVEIIDVDETGAYRPTQQQHDQNEIVDETVGEYRKERDFPFKVVTSSHSEHSITGGQYSSNTRVESKPISTSISRSFVPTAVEDSGPVYIKFVNGEQVSGEEGTTTEQPTTTEVVTETTTEKEDDEEPSAVTSWF